MTFIKELRAKKLCRQVILHAVGGKVSLKDWPVEYRYDRIVCYSARQSFWCLFYRQPSQCRKLPQQLVEWLFLFGHRVSPPALILV